MQSSTINRLVFVAAFAGGIWLGLTMADGAAHADDTPAAAATQRPGGALGAVEDVVDEVLPKPPAEAKPEPAKTETPKPKPPEHAEPKPPEHAEPEHSTEPTQAPEPEDEPAEEPADEPVTDDRPRDPEPTPTTTPSTPPASPIGGVVDGVEDVVEEVVEVITTPPPAPVVLPTPPPVVAPTPTPTAPTPAPEQPSSPLPVVVDLPTEPPPAPALPALPAAPALELPVVIGPIAAPAQLVDDGIYPPGVLPDPAPPVATCDDPIREDDTAPGRSAGDSEQQHRASKQPGEARPAPGARPCPGTPATPTGQAITALSVKPPPPTGEQLVAVSAAGAYSSPVLQRLHQLRGRSHTLAGRTERPEPGPA